MLTRNCASAASFTAAPYAQSCSPPAVCTTDCTHVPARKLGLAFRCATSAASSITGPRAAFTSTASRFIWFSLQSGGVQEK